MIRKCCSQNESPTLKTKVGNQVRIQREHCKLMSSYFPIGGHSVTQTPYMKIGVQTAQTVNTKTNNLNDSGSTVFDPLGLCLNLWSLYKNCLENKDLYRKR